MVTVLGIGLDESSLVFCSIWSTLSHMVEIIGEDEHSTLFFYSLNLTLRRE